YDDNASNTRVYKAGTTVNMKVDLVAHHTGYAVDLKAQKPISRLFTWPVYADETLADFNVVVPDMAGKCSQAGACAIQWFWYTSKLRVAYKNVHHARER
ncbi:hypothetical protein MPER_05890, partial [Moniliophthora perniciosa FA553]